MNKCAKVWRSVSLLVAALALPILSFAAELSSGEKDTIFIGDLKVQPSVGGSASASGRDNELKRIVESLYSQLITALNATRVFQLVERKRKGDIELEQSYAAVAGDPDDKNTARAGKMAGARFALLPLIDGFDDSSESVEHRDIGRTTVSRKIFLSVVVQVVDTTTGKILSDSPSIQLTKAETVNNVRPGQPVGSDKVLVELAKEMAQSLSRELVAIIRPAKVLSVTGKQMLINRGSDAGFKIGDVLDIYATQDVKDEDTGEIYRNEVPVGQGNITRLDGRQSFATIFGEDLGIVKGCIARVARPGSKQKDPKPADTEDESPGSRSKPVKW